MGLAGKLEPGEPAEVGAAREAFEEIGLLLPPAELRLAAVAHWHPPDGTPRIGLFFHCTADPGRHGRPVRWREGAGCTTSVFLRHPKMYCRGGRVTARKG
ncbi:NUDIX domain-containing protein [Dactylosporangium sp. CA-139114]|uniref:NUDIX domain-containing protein n=1 Tax=Dactylosporangium sp. CA-139114 TaxID=3239931 RepID=UPI003D962F97